MFPANRRGRRHFRVTEENKSPNLLALDTCLSRACLLPLLRRCAKGYISMAMHPFTRLEVAPYFKTTPKSSAFWGIYFLPQPLFASCSIVNLAASARNIDPTPRASSSKSKVELCAGAFSRPSFCAPTLTKQPGIFSK